MATIFASRRMRLPLDLGTFQPFRDQLTGQSPEMWRGNDYSIDIGAFINLEGGAPAFEDHVVGIVASGWESLTVEVKQNAGSTDNVMAKTVAVFDDTLTVETWGDLTKAHATVEFTAEETNIAAGQYHIVVSVITTAGKSITLGVSTLTVREDGAHLAVAAPPVNPGDAITLGQADARYVQFGGVTWESISGKPFTAVSAGGNGAADAGKVAIFGVNGSLTSKEFNAYQVSGYAFNASSFDSGTGVAQRFIYGPASTNPGLSILWNGTLIFGSEAGRVATRANLKGFACIARGIGDALWADPSTYKFISTYAVDYDPSGAFSGGVVTVPMTTVYRISAATALDADPAETYKVKLAIAVNGSPVAAIDECTDGQFLGGSVELALDAGDAVSVMLWQNSSNSQPFTPWGDCFFSVVEA